LCPAAGPSQQHVAGRRALETREIDLGPGLADAGELGADLEFRAEAAGDPLQLSSKTAPALPVVKRVEQRGHGRERRFPEAGVDDAVAGLLGQRTEIADQELGLADAARAEQHERVGQSLLDQCEGALGEVGAGIVPGIGRGHR
jgi:hypothetical protein